MFDSLSNRFDTIFQKIRNRGRLSSTDVDEVLREIRLALLEADVHIGVVRHLIDRLRDDLVGLELSQSLSPGEQIIKAVNQELTALLGGEDFKISFAPKPPTVVLLAGLQGSGKTTTSAKLAEWFKSQGRHPLLVGADLQRPAAVEQLRILGSQVKVPVFSEPGNPVEVARKGLEEAIRTGRDVLIVDTAGRLAIDTELMDEVRRISSTITPNYTFFVVDAMIGQDAVSTAKAFHDALDLDAIILTKLDGDARGGAALSVREVVGKPIAFASTGEKIGDFDLFHPERMASRILGMGDVLSLIEKAEKTYDQEAAKRAADALSEGTFNLEDFLEQMREIKKMGSLSGLLAMMPGIPKEIRNANIDEKDIGKLEAIISSMTRGERLDPSQIDGSRKLRIANGAGVSTSQVNLVLQQFKEAKKMISSMAFGNIALKKIKKSGKKKSGGRVTPKGANSPSRHK
ncbi:MAG: signal recognition particle protein [Acidimicrobiales bacterium]|nr:signal recognition particle protein [Acidimicrobiales bacterium]